MLLRLGAFVVLFAATTHLAMVGSPAFLHWCGEQASRPSDQGLRIETDLRTSGAGEIELMLVGSSVVVSHFDAARLGTVLAIDPDAIVVAPLYGGNGLEIAMMTRLLRRARPVAVVMPVTVWTLFDRFEAEDLRLYDPAMALSIFTPRELLADRQAHASGMMASLHFAIRHRATLRHALRTSLGLGGPLDTSVDRDPGRTRRGRARAQARAEQFTCPSIHTRALLHMARRLEDEGVLLVLVATPTNGRFDRDPAVVERRDRCLAALAARPGLAVIPRAALPAFEPSEFVDPLHMSREGRARFTAAVAPPLAALLGRRTPRDALQ